MNLRNGLCILALASGAVLSFAPRGPRMPLTLEVVGVTNLPSANSMGPLWTAYNSSGEVSNLSPASPSHVLVKLRNRTGTPLAIRPLLYQFADAVPDGVVIPKGPSRHRGGVVKRPELLPPELDSYQGIAFGPPKAECHFRTLAPGETAWVALPRPPFDCTWRPTFCYLLPLTFFQTLNHTLKERLHLPEKDQIVGGFKGAAYDEWIRGAWITNILPRPAPAPSTARGE